jgi:FlaA1/EpsC-like NDP-sugar epimerase
MRGMRRRLRSAAAPVHRHSLLQLAVDAGLVALAYYLAFQLRFDQGVPERYERLFESTFPYVVVGTVVIFALFGMYHKWWRYTSTRDYIAIVRGVVVSVAVYVGVVALAHPVEVATADGVASVSPPIGVVALYTLLLFGLIGGSRFVVHLVLERPVRGLRPRLDAREVLIVGAGDGGQLVLREMVRNPDLRYRPVGFVDDDPRKQGMRVGEGLRVLGTTSELSRVLDEVEPAEVIIAIPSAPGVVRARVVSACRERGIPVRTLPTVFELLRGGHDLMRQVREVRVEDVLGREPVHMDLDRVGAYLSSEVVLVTGAGGSIGSELCRQIARVGPKRLVIVDHAEDNLFAIMRELTEDRHCAVVTPVLADCKEQERMREVFKAHRPTVVFHAAAYKHVGLMEGNAVEAVRNNALATRVVTRVAGDFQVSTFVLVSTDKAVAPATVMGASKALAEWCVEAANAEYPGTRFITVRFGNVLGSSNSVVPIFQRQIAAGGPVTVTDPKMTRYFMTIPEAVQLIIRAGSLGKGGEVFVLDMGEPVSILELARAMISLSGLEPERDVAIEFIGRRGGEKLHEQLFDVYERPKPTPAERILLAERSPVDPEWVEEIFDQINLLVLEGDAAALAKHVANLSSARADMAATESAARSATESAT